MFVSVCDGFPAVSLALTAVINVRGFAQIWYESKCVRWQACRSKCVGSPHKKSVGPGESINQGAGTCEKWDELISSIKKMCVREMMRLKGANGMSLADRGIFEVDDFSVAVSASDSPSLVSLSFL